ncbi:MAG: IS1595 family transposase [Acidimicrobiales bacterium]
MAPGNRKAPKRSTASESRYSLVEFMDDFPDDETCLTWLWNTRYNLGDTTAHCERCGEVRTFRRYAAKQQRQDWTCTACGLHVHPTAGTIFHKSSTSLHLWFYAMYLMTSTRCGISAKQLERELGVTYKTAWRMFTLIRNELMTQDTDATLSGRVEMDETYVGGKPRLADKAKWDKAGTRQSAAVKWAHDKKVPVFGMVERSGRILRDGKTKPEITRHGKIAAYVVPKQPQAAIVAHIDNHVEEGTIVYTDDARIYDRLDGDGRTHRTIKHSEGVYVSGEVHTQTIEGFWSLVKRGISGTHHSVSPKWLQGYVNEYVWRFNHRDDGRGMFAALLLRSAFPVKL